jgi:hypothetical protein
MAKGLNFRYGFGLRVGAGPQRVDLMVSFCAKPARFGVFYCNTFVSETRGFWYVRTIEVKRASIVYTGVGILNGVRVDISYGTGQSLNAAAGQCEVFPWTFAFFISQASIIFRLNRH